MPLGPIVGFRVPCLFSLWAQLDRSRCPSRKGRVLGTLVRAAPLITHIKVNSTSCFSTCIISTRLSYGACQHAAYQQAWNLGHVDIVHLNMA